jgi:hypothetical protein
MGGERGGRFSLSLRHMGSRLAMLFEAFWYRLQWGILHMALGVIFMSSLYLWGG